MDSDGEYLIDKAPYTYVMDSLLEIEWSFTPVMDGLSFTLELYYKDNSIGAFAKAGTLFKDVPCEEDDCETTYSWTVGRGLSTDPDSLYYFSLSNIELKPVHSDLFKIVNKPKPSTTSSKVTFTVSPTSSPSTSTESTTTSSATPTPPASAEEDNEDETTGGDSTTGSPSDSGNTDTTPKSGTNDSATGSDPSLDTTTADSSLKKSLSGGAIAGIVIGALAGIGLIALAAWLIAKRRRSEPEYPGMVEVEANHKVEMSGESKAAELAAAARAQELNGEEVKKPVVYELPAGDGEGRGNYSSDGTLRN